MNLYEVVYTDNKYGDLVRTEIAGEDESDALDCAMQEDYYFGKLVELNLIGENV